MTGEERTLALKFCCAKLARFASLQPISSKSAIACPFIFMLQCPIATAFSPRQPGQNAILYYLTQAIRIFGLGQLPATI